MKFIHGKRCTCKIQGTYIKDAKTSIDKDGFVYICQNKKNGDTAPDKLGYRYSWVIGVHGEKMERNSVTDFKYTGKGVSMKNYKWGVKYEEDSDPIELFKTKKEAEEFISELLDKPSVVKSKIYLFEIGKVFKVNRPVRFDLVPE